MRKFICGSCDDIFFESFIGDKVDFKFKGKPMSEEYCLICSLDNKLLEIYSKFPIETITLSSEKSKKEAIFNPVQLLLLETCVDEFNEKHNSKFSIDFFGFGIHKFEDRSVHTSWENEGASKIRYANIQGVG